MVQRLYKDEYTDGADGNADANACDVCLDELVSIDAATAVERAFKIDQRHTCVYGSFRDV